MADQLPFEIVRPYGRVTVVLEVFEDNGERICGLRWVEGEIHLPPKALIREAIKTIRQIENMAREAGCVEMRHAGDARALFFPDYEPFEALRNGRRKRLTDG